VAALLDLEDASAEGSFAVHPWVPGLFLSQAAGLQDAGERWVSGGELPNNRQAIVRGSPAQLAGAGRGPAPRANKSYDDVREKSDSSPDNEVPFFGISELPPKRSTNPAMLFPKAVLGASGLPSMRAFWMAS